MAKQGKNIYQRKDGRWEGRYIKGHEGGKAKYGYVFGKSYEEAEQKLDELVLPSSRFDGNEEARRFSSISDDWLESLKPQLKPASIARYSNILASYLVPEYGACNLEGITRDDVSSLSRKLLIEGGIKGTGLAPKTVNSILSVMKNIFDYASSEKGLRTAAIRDISVKQPQKPLRILSRNEQQKFSRYLMGNLTPCNLGILLCLYTGLRIGEICALKWLDIYFEEQHIHVHQSMQRIQIIDGGDKKTEVQISAPKSDFSIRKIPLPDEMLVLLKSSQKQDDAFLLTGMVHSFVEPRCMENYFKSAVEECGLEDVNFHALRHTFATRCVELGFDIKSLSEILGHSSVNITLNRYVHPSMELKQMNMNMLSDFLTTKYAVNISRQKPSNPVFSGNMAAFPRVKHSRKIFTFF